MNVSGHLLQNRLCGTWVVAINTELSYWSMVFVRKLHCFQKKALGSEEQPDSAHLPDTDEDAENHLDSNGSSVANGTEVRPVLTVLSFFM